MKITWFGQSCFKIENKKNGDSITIATDPFNESVGLKAPKFNADILTISYNHTGHTDTKAIEGKPFTINTAGEYDVKGIMIQGIDSFHDKNEGADKSKNVIYRIEVDGISIAHLGNLKNPLNNEQLTQLEKIDILLIPVGGEYTLNAKQAAEVVAQIEPRIVIPMHYKIENLNLDIENVDSFVKNIGTTPSYEEQLKIEANDLPQEDMEMIILKPFQ